MVDDNPAVSKSCLASLCSQQTIPNYKWICTTKVYFLLLLYVHPYVVREPLDYVAPQG